MNGGGRRESALSALNGYAGSHLLRPPLKLDRPFGNIDMGVT